MKPHTRIILGAALGTILSGCTSRQSTLHREAGEPPPPASHRLAASAPGWSRQPASPLPADPTGALTIRDAADLALARSPTLVAFRSESLRARALERQAGIWDNPELEVEVEKIRNEAENPGSRATETTIAVAQKLPLGRDAALRRRMAEARSEAANWEFEAARLEVLLQVNQRFIQALTAERRVRLATRELELARQTRGVIQQLVESGKISPVELSRIEVPVVEAELALRREERRQSAASRQLSLTWGSGQPTFVSVSGELEAVVPPPSPESLVRLINSNPTVARWGAAISEQVAARRLAWSTAIPDPTLRIGMKERDQPDEETFIVGINFPLPLFDRSQGDLAAAREGETAARARMRASELHLAGLLEAAYTGLANAYDEAVALRERALPAAENGFKATRLAFSEGKLGLLDVLDAQRTLFGLESRYLEALATCHLKSAEIESLIGQPIEEVDPAAPIINRQ